MLSSALKIGIIFAIFSLVGYIPVEIERFIISASVLLITFDEYFNNWVGHEYKPWDLLIGMRKISNSTSAGVTRLEANEESGELDLFKKKKNIYAERLVTYLPV